MTARQRDRLAAAVMGGAAMVVVGITGAVCASVLWAGWPGLSLAFLTEAPSQAGREGGVGPMIAATGWVLGIALTLSVPLGLGAGAYLAEYGGRSRSVRLGLDVLAATPSIVYGLFGLAFFCEALGLGWSVLAGGLCVGLMILPLFVRLTEVGLRAVSDEYRLAGAALGLPRWALFRRVLLPQASPAIAAALVLSVGRVLAESAIFLYTAGASTRWPESAMDPGRVLAVHVYLMAVEVPGGSANAATTALVLLFAISATTTLAGLAPRWLLRVGR